MRNNDINDEDFGKEIPEDKQPVQTPAPMAAFGLVVLACVASVIVALTIQLDKWIVH